MTPEESFEFLRQSIASHNVQIAELIEAIDKLVAADKERATLDKERAAIDKERAAIDNERAAVDRERFEFLVRSIESHDRQIGELTGAMNKTNETVNKLVDVTNEDATAIRTLARIAERHDKRISQLEER